MKIVVSEKGQVTIPKRVRDELGLKPGTRIEFQAERGRLIGTKAVDDDVVSKWMGRGKLPVGNSTDEYLRIIRDADSR
jgi:AbrB family looped-hinge helix DNA binding protein